MSKESDLVKTAYDLVQLLDKAAEDTLPEEIADVVTLHAKLAVGSAWIPVPGADVAAGAATMWTMYLRINSKIGMSFGENILKTIASGVATNLAGYAAALTVGGALKFIPVIGSVGGALVMSATLYALTLTSGYIYLKAITAMLKSKRSGCNDEKLKQTVESILRDDTNEIKNFMNAAKKSYKKES